ncbi:MAG: LytTR family DNA-binding domain-containing protein [Ferruginibacter sp.]
MIKAVLIDDELHCIETLTMLLTDYCPEVNIIATFQSPALALTELPHIVPDVIFLDVEMPVLNGFELLQQLMTIPFAVIFTTSYDQYAIKAIRFSALDYLLKPIDSHELIAAVHKLNTQKKSPSAEQLNMLMDRIQNKPVMTKIAIPAIDGFELIAADQVIYCEASDNYTHFYLKNKTKVTSRRTLKEVEEQLKDFNFFLRVHHSFLINLNEVIKYVRGEGGYLIMSNTSMVNVSRTRKDSLLKYFA